MPHNTEFRTAQADAPPNSGEFGYDPRPQVAQFGQTETRPGIATVEHHPADVLEWMKHADWGEGPMPEFMIDSAIGEKLRALGEVVLIKDGNGRVLGRLVPEVDPAEYQLPDAQDHGLSPEELARRLAPDAKTFSTAEVLAHLRSLK